MIRMHGAAIEYSRRVDPAWEAQIAFFIVSWF